MVYEDFIDAVARRAGVPVDQAGTITRATLETLAERISGGEANDLANQVPEGLDDHLRKTQEHPEVFGLGEFVQRVTARAGIDGVLASSGIRAVLTTLREAVPRDEFEDMVAQLPKDFWEVVPVGLRGR
ncbi:Uncharacterized conserved protein, DUF2267 family [Micromonospora rhizosphaerae]|uniref:Uncharacterized conserved protein, DUF2267 family n=1 Tax=Micromonospora rhizosphaerae TaxID=568872 RepID=A0A1C6SUE2_9ACTN|nr:DUF2267 domain-containing protein [Micromonospora rhizosphaerae]SCL32755.1 Uncharacterized conserved protein, DUF2267 family [Micromonospora rhizosphaerae]